MTDIPESKLAPEKEFAQLGVSFLMVAGRIKELAEHAKMEGPPSKQKIAEEILEALFSPVEVNIIPPDDEALELARKYEELVEQS